MVIFFEIPLSYNLHLPTGNCGIHPSPLHHARKRIRSWVSCIQTPPPSCTGRSPIDILIAPSPRATILLLFFPAAAAFNTTHYTLVDFTHEPGLGISTWHFFSGTPALDSASRVGTRGSSDFGFHAVLG
jgi:hypothetical protein